ncbi:glycosyltransferase family 39 protein [Hymenobacter cellulosivorans]|uniref:Glycosyltransferase family 39 protein n=1 Tax=Hymenobacter cellulosivorans TaxID=2932249 RepID=A0ABY4F4I6_9BACT|nr:glycosyltransferase family 39 protein [Hymenobacter cellulosivorans]UOQ50834.1 glycosyltransferase family 39 protein [Hymenobacter cellulosivorans]
MSALLSSRTWLWLFVLALGAGLLVGLSSWGVVESSEARYAEISREMLASGDWLHPRLLGIQHFHKPPVTYWLTAAGIAAFGPTPIGVRVPAVLAVLAQVVLVFGLGKLLFRGDARHALAAAILYGTFPVVLISALNVTTDAYLMLWELAAAYGILRYLHGGGWRWFYLFWVSLGLAFLTKGPVGAVLPLMVVAGHYFRQSQPRRPFTIHHLLGLGLLLGIGLSWYVYLVAENKAFLDYFLWKQTAERFANADAFKRAKPWWFYLALVPVGSLPWVVALLVQGIRTRWAALPQQWRNVLLFWVVVPLVFFSLAKSKLLLYLLPIFPGLALLTVYYLGQLTDAVLYRWYVVMSAVLALLMAGLCLLPALAGPLGIAAEISPLTSLWPAAGIVALVLQQVLWTQVRVAPRLLALTVIFALTLLLTAKPILHQNQLAGGSMRPLAEWLRAHRLDQRPVLVYDEMLPSLAFELNRMPITLVHDNDDLKRETQFEADSSWQQVLVNANDSSRQVYVRRLLRENPVLVVRGELEDYRAWMLPYFPQQEHFGPWTIYYRSW